jgi:hypothetical protein
MCAGAALMGSIAVLGASVLSKGIVVLRGIVQASAADLTNTASSHSSNHLTNKSFEG